MSKTEHIAKYLEVHPRSTTKGVAERFNVSKVTVYAARRKLRAASNGHSEQVATTTSGSPHAAAAGLLKACGMDVEEARRILDETAAIAEAIGLA